MGETRRGKVPFEGFGETVGFPFYFEDFYGAVGGTGCEAAAVVVEYCVVLGGSISFCDGDVEDIYGGIV
jgi:hypothetical protein